MPTPLLTWISNKALLVRPDGQCLFLRDTGTEPGHEYTRGWWDLPGGRMDVGDLDFIEALKREVREEVGYEVADDASITHFHTGLWRRPDGHYTLCNFYRINIAEGFEPTMSSEHSEVVWNTVADQVGRFHQDDHAYVRALHVYLRRYGRE